MAESLVAKPSKEQKINVKVTEVVRGISYRGAITIGTKIFDYTLKFPISLAELDAKIGNGMTPGDFINTTELVVKVGEKQLTLEIQERMVILDLGLTAANALFEHPQNNPEVKQRVGPALELLNGKMEFGLSQTAIIYGDNPVVLGLLRKAD
jgi:hypothetical protein